MTDLSTLIDYDREHELRLENPATFEPLNAVFYIVSPDSKKCNIPASAKFLSPEHLCHCVVGWDWNGDTFEGIDPKAECTPETALKVLDKAPWINNQIIKVVADLGNFIPE